MRSEETIHKKYEIAFPEFFYTMVNMMLYKALRPEYLA